MHMVTQHVNRPHSIPHRRLWIQGDRDKLLGHGLVGEVGQRLARAGSQLGVGMSEQFDQRGDKTAILPLIGLRVAGAGGDDVANDDLQIRTAA